MEVCLAAVVLSTAPSQSRLAQGLRGCRVAGLQGCRVAGLQVAGLQGCGLRGCGVAFVPAENQSENFPTPVHFRFCEDSMHEYDIALKSVLRRSSGGVLRELTGFTVARWHNVELPAVQNRRADLLGETADGIPVHIELQTTNQKGMVLRMLEYAVAIHRQFRRFPEQVVLYVGERPLRMARRIAGPQLEFGCRMVDIRSLDGEALIGSSRVEDNVIAILARLGDKREAVRRILHGIGGHPPRERGVAFEELMLLAGLRKLEPVIAREARQMPILNDIMDHQVIGRERKRGIRMGIEQGLEQGIELGIEQGLEQGIELGIEQGLEKGREQQRKIVLRMAGKRFGTVPAKVKEHVAGLTAAGLERMALRLLDARSLDELLK